MPLAVLVFPVSLLAFTYPIDGSDDALVPRLSTLGLCDPLDVFPFATGAEGGESSGGLLIGLERPAKFGWCFDSGRGRFRHFVTGRDRAGVLATVNESCCLAKQVEHLLVGGQVFNTRKAPERTHGVRLQDSCVAQDGRDFFAPEAEATVLFKGGHVAEDDALVFEEGTAPLDGFNDAGTSLVDQFPQVIEERLCEGTGLGNVDVDSGIEGVGWAHVSLLMF